MVVRHGQSRVRRLLGDRRGSVSIEFAIVAFPFLMMVMAILELGIMIVQESVMYGALEEGARQLRTGVVQTDNSPESKFRDIVCGNLHALMTCADVAWDVRGFSSYSDVALSDLGTGPDGMPSGTVFQPGGAGDITTVRIFSQYNFITPFLGVLFNDGANGRLLTYTLIVKGEPWD